MDDAAFFAEAKTFLLALAYTQPRILGVFIAVPLFNPAIVPGLLRYAIAAAIGLLVAPTLMPALANSEPSFIQFATLSVKEVFVGFVMGYVLAIPFWAFEAVGFLIDNQRGASVASTLNPITGNDSSPLGLLFNQAFIVFFLISGGFMLMLTVVYQSFADWNVLTWFPTLRPETVPLLLDQLDRLVRIAMLLGAPAIVAMFLAEIALALVSRFVPQLQVFFLAMPIKCGIAMLVLMLYMATLFDYGARYIEGQKLIMPKLAEQWREAPPATQEEPR